MSSLNFIESCLCLTWWRYNLHDDFQQFLFRIFPDVLFYHLIDSSQRKANCTFVRLSSPASYFKQTQRLYIIRVPLALWFYKDKIYCFGISPNTSSRNHNCGSLYCSLKHWPKRNYTMFSNSDAVNICVKFSRSSYVQRLRRTCAASYNEHPILYIKSKLLPHRKHPAFLFNTTNLRQLYLTTQSVPCCKHFSSRL
jgi:hypothetical protein